MKRLLVVFMLLVFLLLSLTVDVFGYVTYNNHKLKGGIGNHGKDPKYYWISSSAQKIYTHIEAAFRAWNSNNTLLTPMHFERTSQSSISKIDLYYGDYIKETGVTAQTRHIVWGKDVNPYYFDWDYAIIEIQQSEFEKIGRDQYGNHKKGCISHEIGHALGLDHTYLSPYIIMWPYSGGTGDPNQRRVDVPQYDDYQGINYLYA